MRVIGITGGVGSGKSLVLDYLKDAYGAVILRSDDAAHELYEPGGPCYAPMLELLGEDCLLSDGTFDRRKIAAKTFTDAGLLDRINAVVHPAAWQHVQDVIREEEERGTKLFIVESALIANEKGKESFRELWYVFADENVRRERLRESRGYTDEKTTSIIENQVSEEEFRKYCSVVIDNSGDFEDTKRQIDGLLKESK